jgi:hypothetical protein
MAELTNTVPLMGPSGLYQASPDEVGVLLSAGYKKATPEEIEFSTPTQTALGVGEAVGRGLLGPVFTGAERLLGAEPERIKAREEISVGPGLSTGIEFGTMLLPGFALSKAAKLAEAGAQVPSLLQKVATASKFTTAGAADILGNVAAKGVEGKIAKLALKYGTEGALFSVQDDVDRMLISDEPEDAIKATNGVILNAGLSFLTGAGLGAGIGKVSELWKAKNASKVARALEQSKIDSEAPAVAGLGTPVPTPTTEAEVLKVTEGLPELEKVPLESRAVVEDAVTRLGDKLKVKPHEGMLAALEDPEANRILNTVRQRGDKLAQAQNTWEQYVKKDAVEGINNVITALGPAATADETRNGLKAVQLIKNNYEKVRGGLEGFFDKFNKVQTNPIAFIGSVTGRLEEAIPGIGDYLQFDGLTGKVKLAPWDATAPFTKKTHAAAKNIIDAINQETLTIGKLRNARKNLTPYINYVTGDAETNAQVGRLKKSLMDMIQDEVEKVDSSLNVREAFKTYAINEESLESLERILGGKIGGKGVTGKEIVPEDVIKKIFSNSVTVADAKRILGEKDFNNILADYLMQAVKSVTDPDKKTFSSARFKNFLVNKAPELEAAFGDNLGALQDLKDFNAIMRIIPDAQVANPSKTAPTLIELAKQIFNVRHLFEPGAAATKLGEVLTSQVSKAKTSAEFNAIMQGADKKGGLGFYRFIDNAQKINATAFQAMQDYIQQAARGAYLLQKAAKNVFETDKEPTVKPVDKKKLEKLDRKIKSLENNIDGHLELGGEIGYYMPQHSTALGMTSMRVSSYLNQKRPQPKPMGALSKPLEPTAAEMSDYYRTLQIAENPSIIFTKIKAGSLNSKDVNDLKNMYPELYAQFATEITNQIVEAQTKQKTIPFKVKKSLSLFAGQPLDNTLAPEAIQSAQATYQPQAEPQAQELPQMAKKSSRKSQLPKQTQTDQQRRILKE